MLLDAREASHTGEDGITCGISVTILFILSFLSPAKVACNNGTEYFNAKGNE